MTTYEIVLYSLEAGCFAGMFFFLGKAIAWHQACILIDEMNEHVQRMNKIVQEISK